MSLTKSTDKPSDDARIQAVQLAHQTHLTEYSALREQIVEWTRIQWVVGTATLGATIAGFAFLSQESESVNTTLFLVLPLMFVYLEAYIITLARQNINLAAYMMGLSRRVKETIESLDKDIGNQPFLHWEEHKRSAEMWSKRFAFPLLVPLFQPSIWVVASGISIGFFLDRERSPNTAEVLLIGFDILANLILVGVAYIFPMTAERSLAAMRPGSLAATSERAGQTRRKVRFEAAEPDGSDT